MLLDFLRFLRGSVCFEIHAPFPERFLNIMMKNRVRLWGTKRSGDRLYSCMYMRDYRRIRPLARRAKARLSIQKKCGLPVYLAAHTDRAGIFLGAAAFFLTVFVMSQFVLSFEITGLSRISQAQLKEDLKEQGFYVGAFKPLCDFSEISRNVMIGNKDVGWMAINVQGSFASVEIKEESLPPFVENIREPCNIKASSDGTIVRMNTKQGDAVIKEGSGVIKDQLLISGVTESETGGVSFVHADAQVTALTEHAAVFSVEKDRSALIPAEEKKQRRQISFLGLYLPIGFSSVSSPYSTVRSVEKTMRFLDINIPIGCVTERITALSHVSRMLSKDEAKAILEENALLYETFSLSECEVKDRDERFSDEGDRFTLSVTYHTLEDIAYASPIMVEEE